MKEIYIFKHNFNSNAPPPLPHSFALRRLLWTFIVTTPSLKKNLDMPLLSAQLFSLSLDTYIVSTCNLQPEEVQL